MVQGHNPIPRTFCWALNLVHKTEICLLLCGDDIRLHEDYPEPHMREKSSRVIKFIILPSCKAMDVSRFPANTSLLRMKTIAHSCERQQGQVLI